MDRPVPPCVKVVNYGDYLCSPTAPMQVFRGKGCLTSPPFKKGDYLLPLGITSPQESSFQDAFNAHICKERPPILSEFPPHKKKLGPITPA